MPTHRTDWGSLLAGLLFLALGVAFVVRGSTAWDFEALWVLPVLALGLGVAGIVRTVSRQRERDGE